MYHDEIFEKALKDVREEQYRELRNEVKTIEELIENMLTQFLECTTAVAERDFNVSGIQTRKEPENSGSFIYCYSVYYTKHCTQVCRLYNTYYHCCYYFEFDKFALNTTGCFLLKMDLTYCSFAYPYCLTAYCNMYHLNMGWYKIQDCNNQAAENLLALCMED